MTRQQFITIFAAIILFLGMYFGCETKTIAHDSIEKSRALSAQVTDASLLIEEAKQKITRQQATEIQLLEQEVSLAAPDTTVMIEALKAVSGKWYDFGFPSVAGYFAEEIANILDDDESWAIAGSTFAICMKNAQNEKVMEFCSAKAFNAFENAVSLAPANVTHQVNLALCYTEAPPVDNPMKGIQMLLGLDDKYPNTPLVLNNLASLAIKTGQYDRALERAKTVLDIEPENKEANCLAAIAYQEMGEGEKAAIHKALCEK